MSALDHQSPSPLAPRSLDKRTLIDGAKVYDPIDMLATVRLQLYELIQPMRFGDLRMRVVFRVRGSPPP